MINKWYAVMENDSDSEWGYGSNDVKKAISMAEELETDEAYIVIIDTDDEPFCIGTIRKDEEGNWVSK